MTSPNATSSATTTSAETSSAATTFAATSEGLRVLLFAALRERAGWGERRLPLQPDLTPVTPVTIWKRLELGPWPAGVRVAVNQEFAAPDQPLAAGDELAFLPPISGG